MRKLSETKCFHLVTRAVNKESIGEKGGITFNQVTQSKKGKNKNKNDCGTLVQNVRHENIN